MSLDVASSAPSIKYLPSISPSMSISAVAERNRRNRGAIQRAGSIAELQTKVRLERLGELVLALDREISSGGGDNVKIPRGLRR
ncbi:hypothetical protein BDZ94DRAFT_1246851 [Collybia nuda]|uniref:Uncharacterized protein n=1 Tax=Collybia nuda TaxID=64659 RepID=A0A9P5YFT0_9AGAR|nr:hypothetical protein BDZ94DRAFT_1246851 [Collybia nuda]